MSGPLEFPSTVEGPNAYQEPCWLGLAPPRLRRRESGRLASIINEKRSSLEILHEVLRLASQNHRKTRIMYGANLSYDMLVKYLDFLTNKGFVAAEADSGRFRVTEEGREFMRDLEKVTRHLRDSTP